jgi:hypothetical protein
MCDWIADLGSDIYLAEPLPKRHTTTIGVIRLSTVIKVTLWLVVMAILANRVLVLAFLLGLLIGHSF